MIEMNISDRDQREIQRVMNLIELRANKETGSGLCVGATFILVALRTATKIAPKVRRILDMASAAVLRKATMGALLAARGNRYAAEAWKSKGGQYIIPLRGAKTREEARNMKAAQVPRRGFARDAWGIMMRDFAGTEGARAPGVQFQQVKKHTRVTKRLQFGMNGEIRLDDMLRYAAVAFKTRGPATADNAMRRGANAARKWLERRLGAVIPQGTMA